MARWLEKEVLSLVDGAPLIEEWQSARCSACGKYHTTPYMYYFDEYKFCPNCGEPIDGKDINVRSNDEPHKLSNREWKEFLAKQFGISKTSAKEMLHGMMQWKNMDNFKRTFNPIKEEDND
jgi:recombinational DNA repair protein (RecF pathway)